MVPAHGANKFTLIGDDFFFGCRPKRSDRTDLQAVSFTQTTTLDGAGRRTLDQTGFLFPSSDIEYAWTGDHPIGRVHNANVVMRKTLNGFGEPVMNVSFRLTSKSVVRIPVPAHIPFRSIERRKHGVQRSETEV